MTTYYIDLVNGLDANNGTDWSTPKKTITGIASFNASTDNIKYAKTCDEVTTAANYSVTAGGTNLTVNASMNILQVLATMASGWTVYNSAVSSSASGTNTLLPGTTGSVGTWYKVTLPASPATNTKYASYNLGSTIDLSAYQELGFWLYLNQTASYLWHDPIDTMVIKLCSDTAGDTPVHTITPKAYQSTTAGAGRGAWCFYIPGGNLSATVQSIAIYSGSVAPPASGIITFVLPAAFKTASPLRYGDLIASSDKKQWAKVAMITGGTTASGAVYFDTYISGTYAFPTAFTNATLKVYRPYCFTKADSMAATPLADLRHGGNSTSVRASISGGWSFASHVQEGYTFFSENNQRFSTVFGWTATYNTSNYHSFERIFLMDFLQGFGYYSTNGSGGWDISLTDCMVYAHINYWLGYGSSRVFSKIVLDSCRFMGGANSLWGNGYALSWTFTNTVFFYARAAEMGTTSGGTGSITVTGCYLHNANQNFTGSYLGTQCTIVFDSCVFTGVNTLTLQGETSLSTQSVFTFQNGCNVSVPISTSSGRIKIVGLTMSAASSASSWTANNAGSPYDYSPLVIWDTCSLKITGGSMTLRNQLFKSCTLDFATACAATTTDTWFESCTVLCSSATASDVFQLVGSSTATLPSAALEPSIKCENCTMTKVRFSNTGEKSMVMLGGSADNSTAGGATLISVPSPNMLFVNALLSQSPPWTGNTPNPAVPTRIHNFNRTAGDHRVFYSGFKVETDGTTVHTGGGKSWKITLGTYLYVEGFNKIPVARVGFKANKQVTASLWVNCGTNSKIVFGADGYQINYTQVAQRAISSAYGSWEHLTITFTPVANGVMEFWVSPVSVGTGASQVLYYDDMSFSQAA